MSVKVNIEKLTLSNKNYRKVLHTTRNMQLVVMSLQSGQEIGAEIHKETSQFIRIESGNAKAIIKGKTFYLKDGDCVIIPPGFKHNIINTGKDDLKLYTIYTPPEHPKKLIQKYKPDE